MAPRTKAEKRMDPDEGVKYTEAEFLEYYGQKKGKAKWNAAGAPTTSTGKACTVCGNTNHLKADCRFKDKECSICGKVGHLAKVCRNASAATGVKASGKASGKACTVCGNTNHLKADCKFKDKECKNCGKVGHLAKVCRQEGGGAAKDAEKGGAKPAAKAKARAKGPRPAIKSAVPWTGKPHEYDYDLYVIGTGSGGMRATKQAKKMYNVPKVGTCEMPFAMVSVDERSIMGKNTLGGVGGTCVLRGCVPKKYFWYGSHYGHEIHNAKDYGWNVEEKGFNWKTLLEKKRKEMIRLESKCAQNEEKADVDLHRGRGKLIDAHTIYIGEPCNKTVTAKTILLATGTTPSALDIPGKELCISSDHILDVEELPKKLAVIGAGYIACEFACMFAIWGCDTHVVFRKDAPLTEFDDDCRYFILDQMERNCGCVMHKLHTPEGVEKQANGKLTVVMKSVNTGEIVRIPDFDDVLMATGRHPNTWELGLDTAKVELDSKGRVKVDDWNKTNIDNIYAIGDITDRMQLTPVAIQEAMNFLSTLYGKRRRKLNYETIASAIFVQPPMGTCGISEKEAIKKYKNLDIYMDGAPAQCKDGIPDWNADPFNFTNSKEKMMVKVIVNADDDKIIGIHYVGKDAGEIIQGFGGMMYMGCTRDDLYNTVAVHPTCAEELVCIPGIDLFATERQYRDGKLVEGK